MSLNYTEKNAYSVVEESVQANPSITPATQLAIAALLGDPSPDTQIDVGSYDGTTVTKPEGEDTQMVIVDIDEPEGQTVDITIPTELANNPVWIFDTDANIRVKFNTVERVIQSGNGSDKIDVTGDKNTTVDGAGGNDSITSSGGDDSISGGDGQDTITGGFGNDTLSGGDGNDLFLGVVDADTIDGGAGYDVLFMQGGFDDWSFEVDGSLVTFSSTAASTGASADNAYSAEVSNLELVQIAEEASELTQFSYAITNNATEADALRLYQTALGRSVDIEGAQFWLDAVEAGATVEQLAGDFVASTEFTTLWADVENNEQLVTQIYENAFGEAPDAAGLEFWTDALDNGLGEGDFVAQIASSDEASETINNVIVVSSIV